VILGDLNVILMAFGCEFKGILWKMAYGNIGI